MDDTKDLKSNEFDSEFYLITNQDLGKNGIKTHQQAYKHWLTYGRYEGRKVKKIGSSDALTIKCLPISKQLYKKQPEQRIIKLPTRINFKVAVTIYLFGLKLLDYFANYVLKLKHSLGEENVHVYVGITLLSERQDLDIDLNAKEEQAIKAIKLKIECINVQIIENRGGDIGGLMQLFKTVNNQGSQGSQASQYQYQYCYHLHSKSDKIWRNGLCFPLLHLNLNNLIKKSDIGLIGSKKYMFTFKHSDKYEYHLKNLRSLYNLKKLSEWQFVAGTIFIAKIDIVKFIATCNFDEVYQLLNTNDTIDQNWIDIITKLKKNPNNCGNDYAYRSKSVGRKSLLSDYMIEHTYERILGCICSELGFTHFLI